ncbi:MAG: hypothetical protein R3F36_05070 [Candidatus Competibacteraceae bacterium]
MSPVNQNMLVDDLKGQIANGQVVVVVGTGVSVATCENQQVDVPGCNLDGAAATRRAFHQHTENVLDENEAQLLNMQISLSKTDFIAAAELVTERLRGKRPAHSGVG